jgi:hypothetical protein
MEDRFDGDRLIAGGRTHAAVRVLPYLGLQNARNQISAAARAINLWSDE